MGDLSIPADRRAMSYKDFQETLDSCARTKAEYGYNMPRNPDGTVDLDETVRLKFQETQKMGALYNQFYGDVFGDGNEDEGANETTVRRVIDVEDKWQMGFADALKDDFQSFASVPAVAGFSAAVIAVGGLIMFARRASRQRSRDLLDATMPYPDVE